MLDNLRIEVQACKKLVEELDEALSSTMFSSANHNKVIMDARARMKKCMDEMKLGRIA